MDALEIPLHGQCGAHPSQGRLLLFHPLPQAGVQVIQLLMESSVELLQEGGVPTDDVADRALITWLIMH